MASSKNRSRIFHVRQPCLDYGVQHPARDPGRSRSTGRHLVAFGMRDASVSFHSGTRSPAAGSARLCNSRALQTWMLCAPDSEAVGFLVMDGRAVDALFIAPEWLRRGGGTRSDASRAPDRRAADRGGQRAEHRMRSRSISRRDSTIVRRSPTDSAGRPYPLLCLEESHAAAAVASGPITDAPPCARQTLTRREN